MFFIYDETPEVLKNWNPEEGLLLLPSESVFSFMVKNLDKMGVVKANQEIIDMIENPRIKSISIEKIKSYLSSDHLTDIYSKPNKGQLDKLFLKTLDNISEGRDIYTTPEAFALFMEWCNKNYPDFDEEVFYEGDVDNIFTAYANQKSKSITLMSLERILKLFSMFYGKKMDKKDIKHLSKFQYDLIDGNTEEIFKSLSTIKNIVINIYEKHGKELNSCNIFNKILDLLDVLEDLSKDEYLKEKDVFLVLKPSEKRKEFHKTFFKNMLGL